MMLGARNQCVIFRKGIKIIGLFKKEEKYLHFFSITDLRVSFLGNRLAATSVSKRLLNDSNLSVTSSDKIGFSGRISAPMSLDIALDFESLCAINRYEYNNPCPNG